MEQTPSVSGERRSFVISVAGLGLACAVSIDDDFVMAIPGLSGLLTYIDEVRRGDGVFATSRVYHALLAAGGYIFWRKLRASA